LEGVGKANAVFGLEKLDWFNSEYIRRASAEELRKMAVGELKHKNIWPSDGPGEPSLDPALDLLRSRARKLTDFSGTFRAFFTDDFKYQPDAVTKFLREPKLGSILTVLLGRYQESADFTPESTEKTLRRVAEEAGIKPGLLINALRVGLTGQGVAPGLFDVMRVLGRERTLSRIKRLVEYLKSRE
jgi:glutamyl-tRNA synthetase